MKTTIDVLGLIKEKGFNASFIIEKLPISRKTFYKKCREKDWTLEEVKILKSLNVV